MIAQSFIQELLDKIDIVDIVARHLPLKKAGANFTACCPFHNEKTPSFTVNPIKQFYHCFGCGRHGNAINFLIEHTGMGFIEAVESIAAHAGIQIPIQKDKYPGTSVPHKAFAGTEKIEEVVEITSLSSNLYERMELAAKYYRSQLRHSEQAIAYLKDRGVAGKIALRFGIGYAPSGWQNLSGIFADYPSGDASHPLVRAGLVITHEGQKNYDRFRHRIMFPILDHKKKIIGFGGRALGANEPKYLNSPETPLFTKGRELYNLVSAGIAIRKAGRAVVVEGYMDVVMLVQHGIEYVVATLGTATTGVQVQKLLRHTDEIVFCFDGDEAGTKAAWRALETSLPQLRDGKDIKFLFLPEKEDPDSYVRKYGGGAFEALLEKAQSLSVFLCNELASRVNLGTSEGRARLIQQAGPLLSQINAPVFAFMLMKRISELAGVDQNYLTMFLKSKKKNLSSLSRSEISRSLTVTPYRRLIQILLHAPVYAKKLDPDLLMGKDDGNKERLLLVELVGFLRASSHSLAAESTLVAALQYFDHSPHCTLLEGIAQDMFIREADWDIEAEFAGGVARLKDAQRRSRMAELHSRPLASLTPEEKKELQRLILNG